MALNNQYEQMLLEKRGWITRWPDECVFIYSGGMDSTITMAKLLTERRMKLFPLFINRGQTNVKYERESAYFFNTYFQDQFKGLFHSLKEISINVPPVEIKDNLKPYTEKHGHPLRNTILQMIGVQYAISLLNENHTIKSVFCAQIPDDPFPHSTLISLRANTMNICEALAEWDWQITSPNIDPLLTDEPHYKVDMIRWAYDHKLPIEKTRSCYTPNTFPCGKCLTCRRRKQAFVEAEVPDLTVYESK